MKLANDQREGTDHRPCIHFISARPEIQVWIEWVIYYQQPAILPSLIFFFFVSIYMDFSTTLVVQFTLYCIAVLLITWVILWDGFIHLLCIKFVYWNNVELNHRSLWQWKEEIYPSFTCAPHCIVDVSSYLLCICWTYINYSKWILWKANKVLDISF